MAATTSHHSRTNETPPGWAERRIPGLRTLLHGLDDATRERVLALTAGRRHCAPGEPLYQAGSPVSTLYAVQAGALKSLAGAERHRRVVGYHVVGDLLGFAGLASGTHADEAVACDASDVALLPYVEIARMARDVPELHRSLSRVLAIAHGHVAEKPEQLSDGEAQARLAHFLLRVGERWGSSESPARRFALHLDNAEVGSLLALAPEVVDESFAGLARSGLVEHDGQTVALLDVSALRRAAEPVRSFGWARPATKPH